MNIIYDAIVIGAGQAGLAAGYHLQQAGLRFLILEASDSLGGSWPCFYDSLLLNSPARYSSLPACLFPATPIATLTEMKLWLIFAAMRLISGCRS